MSAGRLNPPISPGELERRWSIVRTGMEERRIDVLLMQNNNDFMGGYVKYFTDIPATNGYATTVVFPREDDMTVAMHGPYGTDRAIDPASDRLPPELRDGAGVRHLLRQLHHETGVERIHACREALIEA